MEPTPYQMLQNRIDLLDQQIDNLFNMIKLLDKENDKLKKRISILEKINNVEDKNGNN